MNGAMATVLAVDDEEDILTIIRHNLEGLTLERESVTLPT